MKTRATPEVRRELSRVREFLASRGIPVLLGPDRLTATGWYLQVRSPADLIVCEETAGAAAKAVKLLEISNSVEVKSA